MDVGRGDAGVLGLWNKMFMKGQLLSSSKAAWDAMSPKLRCGDDLMSLQLGGPDVANVELCQGNGVPVPLTHLPPDCGHTTLTNRGLVYATPYDGCGVAQKGGHYVMQILWQGNTAVISCPMPSTTATATLKPPSPGYQEYLQGFWPFSSYLYPGRVYSMSMQTDTPVTTTVVSQVPDGKPQRPKYPQLPWPYGYPGYPFGDPNLVPSSGSDAAPGGQGPDGKPQRPKFPQLPWPYGYPGYPFGDPNLVPSSGSDAAPGGQGPDGKPQRPKWPSCLGLWLSWIPFW
ncbi:cuticle collagen 10-like [Puntigrus tetrazona]|uniref:cuticle collagen 10-like n=1 Tax=Puntigrus tetrazona TaxID=1606681 RepID=UPI001C8A7202|nr:cuticle collagen 10-like [Puntigrus tetrazona]